MGKRSYLSVALIVIAVLTIIAICLPLVMVSSTTGNAYDAGMAAGKMARPYLVGLGIVFLILILIRFVAKKG